MAKICSLCVGTLNEKDAIAQTINDFKKYLPAEYTPEIIVTDSSNDNTASIAESLGARVFKQPRQGYGIALKNSLMNASGSIVVTTDVDGTYPMETLPKLLAKLNEGYDLVSASRLLGKGRVESMPFFNEVGNRIFAVMVSVLYGFNCSDSTTGMRAFKREVITSIEWIENIPLSQELAFKPVMRGFKYTEIPLDYKERIGKVKLDSLKAGVAMFCAVVSWRFRKF